MIVEQQAGPVVTATNHTTLLKEKAIVLPKAIDIFTDGSCLKGLIRKSEADPSEEVKVGSSAFVVLDAKKREIIYEHCCKLNFKPSSPRAELLAIVNALTFLDQLNPQQCSIKIITDSEMSIKAVTEYYDQQVMERYFHKKKNVQLISHVHTLYENINRNNHLRFEHIRSHQTIPDPLHVEKRYLWWGNDRVDKMCGEKTKELLANYGKNVIEPPPIRVDHQNVDISFDENVAIPSRYCTCLFSGVKEDGTRKLGVIDIDDYKKAKYPIVICDRGKFDNERLKIKVNGKSYRRFFSFDGVDSFLKGYHPYEEKCCMDEELFANQPRMFGVDIDDSPGAEKELYRETVDNINAILSRIFNRNPRMILTDCSGVSSETGEWKNSLHCVYRNIPCKNASSSMALFQKVRNELVNVDPRMAALIDEHLYDNCTRSLRCSGTFYDGRWARTETEENIKYKDTLFGIYEELPNDYELFEETPILTNAKCDDISLVKQPIFDKFVNNLCITCDGERVDMPGEMSGDNNFSKRTGINYNQMKNDCPICKDPQGNSLRHNGKCKNTNNTWSVGSYSRPIIIYTRKNFIMAKCPFSNDEVKLYDRTEKQTGDLRDFFMEVDAYSQVPYSFSSDECGFRSYSNIRKLDEYAMKDEMKPYEIDNDVKTLLVRAAMGCGKTKQLISMLEKDIYANMSILIVSHRIMEANTILPKFKKLGFVSYREVKTTAIPNPRVICQFESLHRVAKTKFDIVICDEIVSISNQFSSNLNGKKFVENSSVISDNIANCKLAVFMDANLSGEIIDLMLSTRPGNSVLINNNFKKYEGDVIKLIDNEESLIRLLVRSLQEGKNVVVPSSSKTFCRLAEFYAASVVGFENVLCVTKDYPTDDDLRKKIMENPNEHWKKRCFIFSPTIDSSASFEDHHFDRLIGCFYSSSADINTCTQMMRRVRNLSERKLNVGIIKTSSGSYWPRLSQAMKSLNLQILTMIDKTGMNLPTDVLSIVKDYSKREYSSDWHNNMNKVQFAMRAGDMFTRKMLIYQEWRRKLDSAKFLREFMKQSIMSGATVRPWYDGYSKYVDNSGETKDVINRMKKKIKSSDVVALMRNTKIGRLTELSSAEKLREKCIKILHRDWDLEVADTDIMIDSKFAEIVLEHGPVFGNIAWLAARCHDDDIEKDADNDKYKFSLTKNVIYTKREEIIAFNDLILSLGFTSIADIGIYKKTEIEVDLMTKTIVEFAEKIGYVIKDKKEAFPYIGKMGMELMGLRIKCEKEKTKKEKTKKKKELLYNVSIVHKVLYKAACPMITVVDENGRSLPLHELVAKDNGMLHVAPIYMKNIRIINDFMDGEISLGAKKKDWVNNIEKMNYSDVVKAAEEREEVNVVLLDEKMEELTNLCSRRNEQHHLSINATRIANIIDEFLQTKHAAKFITTTTESLRSKKTRRDQTHAEKSMNEIVELLIERHPTLAVDIRKLFECESIDKTTELSKKFVDRDSNEILPEYNGIKSAIEIKFHTVDIQELMRRMKVVIEKYGKKTPLKELALLFTKEVQIDLHHPQREEMRLALTELFKECGKKLQTHYRFIDITVATGSSKADCDAMMSPVSDRIIKEFKKRQNEIDNSLLRKIDKNEPLALLKKIIILTRSNVSVSINEKEIMRILQELTRFSKEELMNDNYKIRQVDWSNGPTVILDDDKREEGYSNISEIETLKDLFIDYNNIYSDVSEIEKTEMMKENKEDDLTANSTGLYWGVVEDLNNHHLRAFVSVIAVDIVSMLLDYARRFKLNVAENFNSINKMFGNQLVREQVEDERLIIELNQIMNDNVKGLKLVVL